MRRSKATIYYEEMLILERKKDATLRRQQRVTEYLQKQKEKTDNKNESKDSEPER